MSSADPPSKVNKGQEFDSKAAQDALVSKGRVEKVREVDPDEQARQRKKFRMMMGDEDTMEGGPSGPEGAPSPFELFSSYSSEKEDVSANPVVGDVAESPTPRSSYGGVQDAVIASPPYSPPPPVTLTNAEPEEEEASTTGALPRSGRFWDDVNLPSDQPLKPQKYQETAASAARIPGEGKPGMKKPGAAAGKKEMLLPEGAPVVKEGVKKEKKELSLLGPPGKPIHGAKKTEEPAKKGKGFPSPFEEAGKVSIRKEKAKEEEPAPVARYFAPEEVKGKEKKTSEKEKTRKPAGIASKEPDIVPFRFEEQERGGGGQRGSERKIVEIEAPSVPLLPEHVHPMAFAAASTATPYLSPQTVSLFFQMVGQIYVMTTPPGVSTTQIVLNSPSYAESKFYGATITIEKYATAPDSFNIRLTGNDAAVASFRDNIPSLLTAFQNSNLPFRVGRVEAVYSLERPVFRRKERGEENRDAGGGDLGERRK